MPKPAVESPPGKPKSGRKSSKKARAAAASEGGAAPSVAAGSELARADSDANSVLLSFAASVSELAERDVVIQWFASLLSPQITTSAPAKSKAKAQEGAATPEPSLRGVVLPGDVVRSSPASLANGGSGLVCRVSQNERWSPLFGWGSSFPGHLLASDPSPYSSENLKVSLETPTLNGETPHDWDVPFKIDLWRAPEGFAWQPGCKWRLAGGGGGASGEAAWIGDPSHDKDRCKWALARHFFFSVSPFFFPARALLLRGPTDTCSPRLTTGTYAMDMWLLPEHGAGSDGGAFVRRRVWERPLVVEKHVEVESLFSHPLRLA